MLLRNRRGSSGVSTALRLLSHIPRDSRRSRQRWWLDTNPYTCPWASALEFIFPAQIATTQSLKHDPLPFCPKSLLVGWNRSRWCKIGEARGRGTYFGWESIWAADRTGWRGVDGWIVWKELVSWDVNASLRFIRQVLTNSTILHLFRFNLSLEPLLASIIFFQIRHCTVSFCHWILPPANPGYNSQRQLACAAQY